MLTSEIRSQIDSIWNAFWSGGISNPLEVIEQITYLLFIRRLDDLQTNAEAKAATLGTRVERVVFPEGKDPRGKPYDELRWSRFKNKEPREMYDIVADHVFPFLRTLGGVGSTYARHMKDARFTLPAQPGDRQDDFPARVLPASRRSTRPAPLSRLTMFDRSSLKSDGP